MSRYVVIHFVTFIDFSAIGYCYKSLSVVTRFVFVRPPDYSVICHQVIFTFSISVTYTRTGLCSTSGQDNVLITGFNRVSGY